MSTRPNKNQEEYPKSSSQKPGLGFPIVRIVVVFSLAVGTVLNHALGRYSGMFTGENQLFRALLDLFEPDDIALADRYYASFWDFALLDQRNVRLVTRQHQLRTTDFRRGTRLGEGDHLVTWAKPQQFPSWMDHVTYARLPDELVLREVHIRVEQRGFRVRESVLVTTLRDHEKYTVDDLADLYRQRWHVELNLRSLKSQMQMDHLRCMTPEMVRKEIAMHLLADNFRASRDGRSGSPSRSASDRRQLHRRDANSASLSRTRLARKLSVRRDLGNSAHRHCHASSR